VSTYVETEVLPDRMLSLLNTVWKICPRVRSDAARYYAVEASRASCQGLITTCSRGEWGTTWRITVRGLKLLTNTNPKEGKWS